jgi:hypothetical protein
VSFLCPPLRFGAIPVKNGARERISAIVGELHRRRRRPSPAAAAALGASGSSDHGGRSRLKGPYTPWVRSTVEHGPGPPRRSTAASAFRHACVSAGQSQSSTWRSISPSAGRPGVLAKRTLWFLNIAEIPFHLKEPSHISPAFSANAPELLSFHVQQPTLHLLLVSPASFIHNHVLAPGILLKTPWKFILFTI